MTDFSPAIRRLASVWLAYGRCMAGAGAALALGATTFGAEARAWEEFERRCLVPMENAEGPNVGGLILAVFTPDDLPLEQGDTLFQSYEHNFGLVSNDGDADTPIQCAIVWMGDDGEQPGEMSDWGVERSAARRIEALVEEGRYQEVPVDSGVLQVIESTDWTTSKLLIYAIARLGNYGPIYLIEDTARKIEKDAGSEW